MPRPKIKDSRAITARLEIKLFDRLSEFSEKYGQPKTVVIERALKAYMDNYDEMMRRAENAGLPITHD